MCMLKEKREELLRTKSSEAGKYFERKLFDPILDEVCEEIKDDRLTITNGKVADDHDYHCNKAIETVFDFESLTKKGLLWNPYL